MKFWNIGPSGLGRRYYTSTNNVSRNYPHAHQHCVIGRRARLVECTCYWGTNEDRSAKTPVQLASYAREVFGSQPARRFVPGFTICGSLMRLWVFVRSLPYNSKRFDIHKELERFFKVLAGHVLMSDAELGLYTFSKRDGSGMYIVTRDVRTSLEDKPIALIRAIVCRGTTCC